MWNFQHIPLSRCDHISPHAQGYLPCRTFNTPLYLGVTTRQTIKILEHYTHTCLSNFIILNFILNLKEEALKSSNTTSRKLQVLDLHLGRALITRKSTSFSFRTKHFVHYKIIRRKCDIWIEWNIPEIGVP